MPTQVGYPGYSSHRRSDSNHTSTAGTRGSTSSDSSYHSATSSASSGSSYHSAQSSFENGAQATAGYLAKTPSRTPSFSLTPMNRDQLERNASLARATGSLHLTPLARSTRFEGDSSRRPTGSPAESTTGSSSGGPSTSGSEYSSSGAEASGSNAAYPNMDVKSWLERKWKWKLPGDDKPPTKAASSSSSSSSNHSTDKPVYMLQKDSNGEHKFKLAYTVHRDRYGRPTKTTFNKEFWNTSGKESKRSTLCGRAMTKLSGIFRR